MSYNRNYKEYGYIDFSKLWEYMANKNVRKQYLFNNGIHKTSIYKLVRNENVTCEVIAKLCYLLNCQPQDIMEYRYDGNNTRQNIQKITEDYKQIVSEISIQENTSNTVKKDKLTEIDIKLNRIIEMLDDQDQ